MRKDRGKHRRTPIAPDLEAKLLVEARRTCSLCWESQEVQIHHIIPVELGGDNSEGNLIVVCLNCHSGVHTRRKMSRNLSPATLRLYKETWLDLVRRFPADASTGVHDDHDLTTIREILRQAHRRALFYPFDQEFFPQMFASLNDMRIALQQTGYRLIKNVPAREHVHQIYRALLQIDAFACDVPGLRCHMSFYGREGLAGIDVQRQTVCFHVNELAKLAGLPQVIPDEADFGYEEMRSVQSKYSAKRCFSTFDSTSEECEKCELRIECIERTAVHAREAG